MSSIKTYNTKQKGEILDFLIKHKGEHFTVDDLTAKLLSGGINIGKTTVYRHLEKLTENMQVRKYEISKNDAACYEYLGSDDETGCDKHYHLKCTSCGKLFHIDCHTLSCINEHIFTSHGFKVNSVRTVFYGICSSCLDNKKKENSYHEN